MAMTGHKTRAMFDRYSIASTKDIEAALLKATLPAGNPVGKKRNPVAGVLQHLRPLKAVLQRLRLSRVLDTLPERSVTLDV